MTVNDPEAAWNEALYQTLHFKHVLDTIADLCLTEAARERVRSLRPIVDQDLLTRRFTATEELLVLLDEGSSPPLSAFPDIRPLLESVQRGTPALKPQDFQQVRPALALLGPLAAFFASRADLPHWRGLTQHLNAWPEGAREIDRVVEEDLSDGTSRTGPTIKSSASRELARIRAEIRKLEVQVRGRLEALHDQARRSGWAQDEPVAWREGRLVIAFKATHKRKIRGLIHGYSASGATAFVEPLEVFDLNSEIAALRDEEQAEELRLLTTLTDLLRPHTAALALSVELLHRLDAHLARARWAARQRAVRPELSTEGRLELVAARNPVLAEHREVVPLNLRLGSPERILLISGPNAGGKTVVLLTVGLLVLLAQSGLFVPAAQATLPLFQEVFADLGDRQSLQEDLSTFSAHLTNLQAILGRCDQDTLVLLDELGTSTDPEAGAALARAFLEGIRNRGAFCLGTTHLNRLKMWAQDEAGILNGGMEFDPERLSPTYRLQVGRPGASYALEIARRLGLDDQILQRAEGLMSGAAVNLEDLLVSLEEERAGVQRLETELTRRLEEVEQREQEVSAKESEIRAAHRRARKDALREAERLVADINRRLEAAIAEVRSKGAALEKPDIRRAKRTVSREKERVGRERERLREAEPQPLSMDDLKPGMWVRVGETGRPGQVERVYRNRSRVTVSVEGKRLTLPVTDLLPGEEPRKKETPQRTGARVQVEGAVSYRLDLRGKRGDEAVAETDKFLNRAILAGLRDVEIIHGKGTGALQQRVREFLEEHPQVAAFRFANFDAGGTGVTIVTLM